MACSCKRGYLQKGKYPIKNATIKQKLVEIALSFDHPRGQGYDGRLYL